MNFWQFKFNSEYWTNWKDIQLGEIEEWQSPKTINKKPNDISIDDVVFIYRGSTQVGRGIYFIAKVLNVDFSDKHPIKLKIIKDLRENIFIPENFGFEEVVQKINNLNRNGTYYKFLTNENPQSMYDLMIDNKKSIKGIRKKYTEDDLTFLAKGVFEIYIDKYNKNETLQYSIYQPNSNKQIIHKIANRLNMSTGTAENYSERLFNLWNALNKFNINNGLDPCPSLLKSVGTKVFNKTYFIKEGLLNSFTYDKQLDAKVLESKNLSVEERRKRIAKGSKQPSTTEVVTKRYNRNADVIAEVLERASGICEECQQEAPFIRKKDNTPYLEVHHVIQLTYGGEDTVENAIAICPNCHRKLHFG